MIQPIILLRNFHRCIRALNDGNGNVSTANQNCQDCRGYHSARRPGAALPVKVGCLMPVTLAAPTTADNCVGTVTGTYQHAISHHGVGDDVLVTWTFNDGHGKYQHRQTRRWL